MEHAEPQPLSSYTAIQGVSVWELWGSFTTSDYLNAFAKTERPLTLTTSHWFLLNDLPSRELTHTDSDFTTQWILSLCTYKPSYYYLHISEHSTKKGKRKGRKPKDETHHYLTIFSLLPSSSHSSRGFCCLFRHRGSSQDVVFVLWLETKNGNMTFVNKPELKYQWEKSIYPPYYSIDLKAYFYLRKSSITIWCSAN